MATKEPQSPEILARRSSAFEFYQVLDDQGKRPTLQSLALKVGATLSAVKYWKRVDDWDAKISDTAAATLAAAGKSQETIRTMLRAGAAEHIRTLNSIIRDKKHRAGDRIKGIVEFVKLAKELDALDPATPAPAALAAPQFNDDVPNRAFDDIPAPPTATAVPPEPAVEEPESSSTS